MCIRDRSNPISNYLGVHAAALPLREQRMQLIASNLSNADTPNFKACLLYTSRCV